MMIQRMLFLIFEFEFKFARARSSSLENHLYIDC